MTEVKRLHPAVAEIAPRSDRPVGARRPSSLYAQIREELRELIVSGTWQPNDPVPSERELMAQYGVSRITVRQALGDLQKESLIFKLAGKGAYVAQTRPFQELGRLQGFAEAMGLTVDAANRSDRPGARFNIHFPERLLVRDIGEGPM